MEENIKTLKEVETQLNLLASECKLILLPSNIYEWNKVYRLETEKKKKKKIRVAYSGQGNFNKDSLVATLNLLKEKFPDSKLEEYVFHSDKTYFGSLHFNLQPGEEADFVEIAFFPSVAAALLYFFTSLGNHDYNMVPVSLDDLEWRSKAITDSITTLNIVDY